MWNANGQCEVNMPLAFFFIVIYIYIYINFRCLSIFITGQPSQFVMSKLRVKFLIDIVEKRVVFAEAGSDFIDVLFSFLSLPLGRIVRLLGKQSGLGSLDSLYESIEKIDAKYMKTEACKKMLLNPRSAAAITCEDLKIKKIHGANPRKLYLCNDLHCLTQTECYFSYVKNDRCSSCGKMMTKKEFWHKDTTVKKGIFVEETMEYMVTDDLKVMPLSIMGGLSILEKLRINSPKILEERVIDFGEEEVLNLLKRSLISKHPLTEICFPDVNVQASEKHSFLTIKEKVNDNLTIRDVSLTLIVSKEDNKPLCAEVGESFGNNLSSFLAFPLGSVFNLLSDNEASVLDGCLNNVYSSVKNMSCNNREMLLNPKLPSFYGFKNQMPKLEEISSESLFVTGCCTKCYFDGGQKRCFCEHRISHFVLKEQNPKLGMVEQECNDGAYVLNFKRLMISNNLKLSPLSPISAINDKMSIPVYNFVEYGNDMSEFYLVNFVEKDFYLDEAKAQSLLITMLRSKTVLADVFCSM